MNIRPLDRITVVSLEHAIAAPFCTRQLADLGARVIKVERPGGGDFARGYDTQVDRLCSHFVWVNCSKESLTLDLKQPSAIATLKTLLKTVDVLVQNLAPSAAARMGLTAEILQKDNPKLILCDISGYGNNGPYRDKLTAEILQKDNPKLILCDISGYGNNGPYRDKKAYDLLIQSEAGFLSVTGTPETPSKAGISIADIAAGMYAYTNILAALLQRGKTDKGSVIDISMLESLGEWMNFPMYYAYKGAEPPPRNGASHATIYPYGPFKAGDGKTVMLGLQNEREWVQFCEIVLENPALAQDERFDRNFKRNEKRTELLQIIDACFNQLSSDQLIARLEKAQIANAHLNDMEGLWKHQQLQARKRWREVGTPNGNIAALLPPGLNDSYDYRMDPIPAVGEHTDSILKELGIDESDIAKMRASGAI